MTLYKSVTEPVLSCEGNNKKYEIYLAVTEEGEKDWNKERAKEKVSFKVVDVKGAERVVWGPGVKENNQWSNWQLRFGTSGKVYLSVPIDDRNYKNDGYTRVECKQKHIERNLEGQGQEVIVYAVEGRNTPNRLKVEISGGACSPKRGSRNIEECEIKFAHGINLRLRVSMFWINPLSSLSIF